MINDNIEHDFSATVFSWSVIFRSCKTQHPEIDHIFCLEMHATILYSCCRFYTIPEWLWMIYDSTQLFVAAIVGIRYSRVLRACAVASTDKCETVSDKPFPELSLAGATGTFCACTGELCNGDALPAGAARLTTRHMAFSFTLISLLTLMATHFLGQWRRRTSRKQPRFPPMPCLAAFVDAFLPHIQPYTIEWYH